MLQEVYIRVWQRAGDFDPAISSRITGLVTIARNRALDEAQRKTMRSLDDCALLLQLPNEDNPHADHERAEERRRVQACLDALEPEKSEIVRLPYYYGMTREEIAVRITVKTWLRQSLTHLKVCLGQ